MTISSLREKRSSLKGDKEVAAGYSSRGIFLTFQVQYFIVALTAVSADIIVNCQRGLYRMKMKRAIPVILLMCLLLFSCGSTRFAFDRTERSIIELGGTYDKTTEEDIKKFYEAEGLDELILEVYRGTFTDVDVQGYLGDDIYKEYQKREKEMLKEIVTMRNEEGLDEVVKAVLDETYPEAMVIAAFGGEGTQLVRDFREAYEEKKGIKDELTLILQDQGYAGIKDALVNGKYDEETIEEYLGRSTLEKAQEIYAKETGTDGFNPTKKSSSTTTASSSGQSMQFVSSSGDVDYENAEKKETSLITQIVAVVVAVIVFYLIAAVVRSLNRGPVSAVVAVCVTFFSTGAAFGVAFALTGWSIYYLAFLLILPIYFILTADVRD